MKNVLASLQKIGGALMLPVAVLPIAGLLLRFGQPDLLDFPSMAAAGGPGCAARPDRPAGLGGHAAGATGSRTARTARAGARSTAAAGKQPNHKDRSDRDVASHPRRSFRG